MRTAAQDVAQRPQWVARLKQLGIEMPAVPDAVATYVAAVRTGNAVITSGQLPFVAGALPLVGRLGAEVSVEEGYRLAGSAALNGLAAVHELVGLDNVVRVVRVAGYVASADGFTDQAKVLDGASHLIGEIFGTAGSHARAAIGVAWLPLNAPVEVELEVEVLPDESAG